MDRHLLNYLPPVLREVLEFQVINGANEPEISLAWDAITRVLANQFLEDADEDGVAVWEQERLALSQGHGHPGGPQGPHQGQVEFGIALHPALAEKLAGGPVRPDGHSVSLQDYTLDIQLDYTVLRSRTGWRGKSLTCC